MGAVIHVSSHPMTPEVPNFHSTVDTDACWRIVIIEVSLLLGSCSGISDR